jgi:hypothetical protein
MRCFSFLQYDNYITPQDGLASKSLPILLLYVDVHESRQAPA